MNLNMTLASLVNEFCLTRLFPRTKISVNQGVGVCNMLGLFHSKCLMTRLRHEPLLLDSPVQKGIMKIFKTDFF